MNDVVSVKPFGAMRFAYCRPTSAPYAFISRLAMTDLFIDQDKESMGYNVTLPCKPDEFADFIGSLLGKGLSIEKNYTDIFIIDTPAIQQLFLLITQRANQNAGKLISFNSKLYFSDRSRVCRHEICLNGVIEATTTI